MINIATLFTILSYLTLIPRIQAFPSNLNNPKSDLGRRDENGTINILGYEMVGDSGVSAQMIFLGTKNKVYVLDKTENNPITINGTYGTHPAWATEVDVNTFKYRAMDVYSNTFCAGGAVLGNGTWIVFGGNQPVTTGGVATTSGAAYDDTDGGTAIRMINPCDDSSCQWIQGTTSYSTTGTTGGWLQMTGRRWYPMVESLSDGSVIVIGGDKNGGYVNTAAQDNPTYEFWPPKSEGAVNLQFLSDALPINLYPLTWLMPDGRLFMQANRLSILYNITSQETTNLPDMPFAARVYPGSAATAMLPLTPANNYTVTILFCGGSNTTTWGTDSGPGYNVTAVPADNTCVRINPGDPNPEYVQDDYMFDRRSMGSFVMLPDGTFWMGNGVAMGTAGYGDDGYSTGQSYGQAPLYLPAIYNASAPAGGRWNRTGLTPTTNERMYHSTAILLADGSVFIAGSNPNKDFTTVQWGSKTSIEKWYPWYYNLPRPTYTGLPKNISYGGNGFDLVLPGVTDQAVVQGTKVVLIRGGFNTHAISFGARYLELQSTYTIDMNTGNTTLHVSQLPGTPGPTLFQPGPAMFFVVTHGVPSLGEFVMIGSGTIGEQPTSPNAALPSSQVKSIINNTSTASGSSTTGNSGSTSKTGKADLGITISLSTFGLMISSVGLSLLF